MSGPEEAVRRAEGGFGLHYVRGLHTSAHGNAPAYGYPVKIPASFGILSALQGSPGGWIFLLLWSRARTRRKA